MKTKGHIAHDMPSFQYPSSLLNYFLEASKDALRNSFIAFRFPKKLYEREFLLLCYRFRSVR